MRGASLDAEQLQDIGAATDLLRRLAHPSRLMILARLSKGAATVAELERELGLKQPGLSQQLAELRNAGIVEARRDAKSVTYTLADADAARLVGAVMRQFGAQTSPPGQRPARNIDPLLGAAVFARVAETLP